MFTYFFLLVAALFSFVLTPLVRCPARSIGAVGQPGEGKSTSCHTVSRAYFEPIQRRASRFGEGALACMTDVAPLLMRIDAYASTCTTGRVGTYYVLRAHWVAGWVGYTSSPVKANASGLVKSNSMPSCGATLPSATL
jgi:hypothetical protein